MAFSRHTSRIYMDDFDVQGTLKVLSDRIVSDPDSPATPYYVGAHLILNLINNQSEIRDQSVVMRLFDVQLYENGIIENLEGKKIEEV